jgi:hypothetical protein
MAIYAALTGSVKKLRNKFLSNKASQTWKQELLILHSTE